VAISSRPITSDGACGDTSGIARTVVKCAAAISSRLAFRRWSAQQLGQLGDVRRYAPGSRGLMVTSPRLPITMTRPLLAKSFVSLAGTPMIPAADEFGRTQRGNNNAYCQDNEISWVDWRRDDRADALIDFTKRLTSLRRRYPVLRQSRFLTATWNEDLGVKDSTWLTPAGDEMKSEHWQNVAARCFGLLLDGRALRPGSSRNDSLSSRDFSEGFRTLVRGGSPKSRVTVVVGSDLGLLRNLSPYGNFAQSFSPRALRNRRSSVISLGPFQRAEAFLASHLLAQSISRSRRTAGACGFFILSQRHEGQSGRIRRVRGAGNVAARPGRDKPSHPTGAPTLTCWRLVAGRQELNPGAPIRFRSRRRCRAQR
jgi:hypothetical protein